MNSLNIAFGAIFRDQMSHSDVVMSLSLSLLVMNHHQWVHVKLRELYRLKFSQGSAFDRFTLCDNGCDRVYIS